ncbi:hypothetical protein BLOT_011856 [Blomia tropicalis]|nr:hypothetical protein BLOT_011856 [Blomia tropicalis]
MGNTEIGCIQCFRSFFLSIGCILKRSILTRCKSFGADDLLHKVSDVKVSQPIFGSSYEPGMSPDNENDMTPCFNAIYIFLNGKIHYSEANIFHIRIKSKITNYTILRMNHKVMPRDEIEPIGPRSIKAEWGHLLFSSF